MIPGKPYDPRTRTSRRPTPERFEHLKRWVEPIEQNIELTTITEITNIDQQLEQVSKFFISSIISRVIAQLVGAYNDGFVTLQATAEGVLKTETARERQTITTAKIDFSDGIDEVIVAGQADKKIKITTLVFTVGGETNIELMNGAVEMSGPMDFGGINEPRGMVVSQGFLPYELSAGSSFIMKSSAAVQVAGFVVGFIESAAA